MACIAYKSLDNCRRPSSKCSLLKTSAFFSLRNIFHSTFISGFCLFTLQKTPLMLIRTQDNKSSFSKLNLPGNSSATSYNITTYLFIQRPRQINIIFATRNATICNSCVCCFSIEVHSNNSTAVPITEW